MQRRRALLSQNGGENVLKGEFGTAFIERVTIPNNNVTTLAGAIIELRNARADTSTYMVGVRRVNDESPAPNTNELGLWQTYAATTGASTVYAEKYSESAWVISGTSVSTSIVITPGSVFELVQFKLNKEV